MSPTQAAIVTFATTLFVALFSAFVAHRIGWLHFGIMQKAHELNITRATTDVGCTVALEQHDTPGVPHRPHPVVHVTIYNEGELAARNLRGYWKMTTAVTRGDFSRPIQKDVLGKQPFEDISIIRDINWSMFGMPMDIEVEFSYIAQPDNRVMHYSGKYRYDAASRTMIKTSPGTDSEDKTT